MDKKLEALMEQSLEQSSSIFKQMEQLIGRFNLSGTGLPGSHPDRKTTGEDPGNHFFRDIMQLNQLTLSSLDMLRKWETLFESLKLFTGGFPGWPPVKPGDEDRKLEEELKGLKIRLDEQETLIRELQSRLKTESGKEPDGEQAARVLTDFFSEQSQQFQRLLKGNLPKP
ncbi:MAG: hypothetical protein ABIK68_01435 [bacterium]